MLQPSPVPATPFVERFRTATGRRTLSIGLALLVEGLLLFLLLSLGVVEQPGDRERRLTVVNLRVEEPSPETAEPKSPEREQPAEERPAPEEPPPPQPAEPKAAPVPPATIPTPQEPPPAVALPPTQVRPAPSARPVYGPPDTGRRPSLDTERVGTAPNGEPLYAAAWYTEPKDEDLRDYLSTARGPGWGLIACRTVANYHVDDCVALAEYPEGSQINRAVLAAAWEFKVRPPRVGGRSLVGSWVRIRIDYSIERR